MRATTGQRGVTTVEFAILGLLLLVVIFAIIEFGRLIFTLNVLQEAARRGARVATVCAVDSGGVAKAALLIARRTALSSGNVDVQYLDRNGKETGAGGVIHFVRVNVSGYKFRIYLPLVDREFELPEFSSTLPAESLGVPRLGEPPACYEEDLK